MFPWTILSQYSVAQYPQHQNASQGLTLAVRLLLTHYLSDCIGWWVQPHLLLGAGSTGERLGGVETAPGGDTDPIKHRQRKKSGVCYMGRSGCETKNSWRVNRRQLKMQPPAAQDHPRQGGLPKTKRRRVPTPKAAPCFFCTGKTSVMATDSNHLTGSETFLKGEKNTLRVLPSKTAMNWVQKFSNGDAF